MGSLQLSSCGSSFCSLPFNLINSTIANSHSTLRPSKPLSFLSRGKIRAVSTSQENPSGAMDPEQPPLVDFAFVSSVLLPDQTPDVHLRQACGGQKLRNIMLDSNIDLYGPYARTLLNCGGVGTCGTCCSRKRAVKPLEQAKRRNTLKRNRKIGDLLAKPQLGNLILEDWLLSNNCQNGKHMNGVMRKS
ncbi:hypothetical protein GBA52_009749 [Prunus armeniaca]|nr:hypothetical protein GBA52_009749 [Prunus armeniaca]